MALTMPVTIITIPRTQKRPVHEVKSTCQEERGRHVSDGPPGPASQALPLPPGSPSAASWGPWE